MKKIKTIKVDFCTVTKMDISLHNFKNNNMF